MKQENSFSTNQGRYSLFAIFSFTFAILAVLVTGYVMETTYVPKEIFVYGDQPIGLQSQEFFSTDDNKLLAELKGSIYESGENMTVFGACLDGEGILFPAAYANFTAWYPNGTIVVQETEMLPILNNGSPTGRHRIHITMSSVRGTYLTEINCSYAGEFATAIGEWQNPDWVYRIFQIQNNITNITDVVNSNQVYLSNILNNINNFSSDVNNNFSQVLSALDDLNISATINATSESTSQQFTDLRELIHSISTSYWILDSSNPTYSMSSGTHNYQAIDMVSKDNIHTVSSDGYITIWDGETWTTTATNNTYYGVSVLNSGTVYAIYVGNNDTNPIYQQNTAVPQTLSVAGGVFLDAEVFYKPNDPTADAYIYLISDAGEIMFSDDRAVSWYNVHNTSFQVLTGDPVIIYLGGVPVNSTLADVAKISQVVENVNNVSAEGYSVLFGIGDAVTYYDGNSFVDYTLTGQKVKDVELIESDVGFVVTKDYVNDQSKVYYWDGSNFSLQYTVDASNLEFTGIAGTSENDVWITTEDPSVYYYYNGRTWEYNRFAYSDNVGVTVSFGTNLTSTGLKGLVMLNPKLGYSAGEDGLIMKFQDYYDSRFDEILDSTFEVNLTNITLAIQNLTDITLAMNQSIYTDIQSVITKIDSLNSSLNIKLDAISTNLTLIDIVVDDIYSNTLDILVQLGIIQQQLNITIELQNQTLIIVNESAQDIDELVNRSRRLRAWITQ